MAFATRISFYPPPLVCCRLVLPGALPLAQARVLFLLTTELDWRVLRLGRALDKSDLLRDPRAHRHRLDRRELRLKQARDEVGVETIRVADLQVELAPGHGHVRPIPQCRHHMNLVVAEEDPVDLLDVPAWLAGRLQRVHRLGVTLLELVLPLNPSMPPQRCIERLCRASHEGNGRLDQSRLEWRL